MRISDWSSDVCSSDLLDEISGRVLRWQDRESLPCPALHRIDMPLERDIGKGVDLDRHRLADAHQRELCLLEIGGHPHFVGHDRPQLRSGRDIAADIDMPVDRSEEHTSELQSLMRLSYAVY